MPNSSQLRPAFTAFHVILGLALLWGSIHTILHLGPTDLHARIVGIIEAIGAVAFLIPWTLRLGGVLLLVSLGGAVLLHAVQGELRPDLLVYVAGVVVVMLHASAQEQSLPTVSPL